MKNKEILVIIYKRIKYKKTIFLKKYIFTLLKN